MRQFALCCILICWIVMPMTIQGAEPLARNTQQLYQWQIVVQTSRHPMLNERFRSQLVRDITAALRPMIPKELGTIEVIDLQQIDGKTMPELWQAFQSKGWSALNQPEFRQLTGVKTHFLKVQVHGNRFRLETTQHDGSTGIVAPKLRTQETTAVETVGRLAGLLIGKDFGPVATIERIVGDPEHAYLHFQGGELPGFAPLIKIGDVFAISIIREQKASGKQLPKNAPLPPAEQFAQPQEYTLLRVLEKRTNGSAKVQVITRWAQPFPAGRNIIGYRALKLTTVDAPIQVKLLGPEDASSSGSIPLQVWATDDEFTNVPNSRSNLFERDGVYQSGRDLRGIACVTIRLGASRFARFPIPVLGGTEPAVLRFIVQQDEIAKAEFEQNCERLRGRITDITVSQVELFRNLGKLITEGENQVALERASQGLDSVVAADQLLSAELQELKKDPAAKEDYPSRLLAASEDQLQALRLGRPELEKRVDDLKAAIAKADDPVKFEREFKASELQRQIRYHVQRGEIPEALDFYDQLYEFTKLEEAKTLKQKLVDEWQTKSEEHKTAREFLLEKWRKANDLNELKTYAPRLVAIADILAKHEDRLGLRNLNSSIQFSYNRLKEILDTLDQNSESDRQQIQDVKTTADAIRTAEEKALSELKKLDIIQGK